MDSFFDKVYQIVKKIPAGKVATYGQIALRLRSGPDGSRINISPRTVGWALHANRDERVPCHRVVNKDGRLAPNFGFSLPSINRTSRRIRIELKSREGRLGGDGEAEQRRRLLAEGITFNGKNVNLSKHLWAGR